MQDISTAFGFLYVKNRLSKSLRQYDDSDSCFSYGIYITKPPTLAHNFSTNDSST